MFAQFRKVEKVGRFDEKTTVGTRFGDNAVKVAKMEMGSAFNSNPKVLEVEVWNERDEQVLKLSKNPLTLTCIYRVSRQEDLQNIIRTSYEGFEIGLFTY